MKMPFGKAVLLAGSAALLAPVAASAQDVRDLSNAQSDVLIFEGEVTTTPVVYLYSMAAGTSLLIDVIPASGSDLDPTITVSDTASGEMLAEDDDGGEGVASRARIYAEAARQVEITVSPFAFLSGEESAGAFELQLRSSDFRPPETRPVTYGSVMEGEFSGADSHAFTFQGEAGQLLEVALVAQDDMLDPTLSLYEGTSISGDPLSTNDDGGDGLNSLLRHVFSETGTYTIVAEPYANSSGKYSLRVAELREHVVQSPQQVIGFGERMAGALGSGYENGGIDPATITYQLTPEAIAAIRAGSGEVTFNMTTPLIEDEDFPSGVDSLLELGIETPLGFASIMTDDDGGEGLNARIAVDLSTVSSAGDWLERLRLKASSIGEGGPFEIELADGMQGVEVEYLEEIAEEIGAE